MTRALTLTLVGAGLGVLVFGWWRASRDLRFTLSGALALSPLNKCVSLAPFLLLGLPFLNAEAFRDPSGIPLVAAILVSVPAFLLLARDQTRPGTLRHRVAFALAVYFGGVFFFEILQWILALASTSLGA